MATNAVKIETWLNNNSKGLSWKRVNGDSPAVKLDRLYINRSEAYEIRDFILRYFKCCKLEHNDDNYEKSFKKILSFKKGEKVKSEDMLNHLKKGKEKCCNS